VKSYTDHIQFHIIIVIYDFCYNLVENDVS